MPSFDSTDLDNATSESGVVHQNTANTDHTNASRLKQGYDYANFSEITPNPLFCHPMQEDSGTTMYDLSGNGYNGSYSGPTLGQAGPLGTTAPSWDGTDDTATTGWNTSSVTSYTNTIWVKFPTASPSESKFIYHCTFASPFALSINTSGEWHANFETGGTYDPLTASITGSAGVWHFVAQVYDQNSGGTLYVDGVERASHAQTGDPAEGGNPVTVGANSGGSSVWAGALADYRHYNQALTTTQIQTLYDVATTAGTLTTGFKTV